jgi:hypothetical protein
MAEKKVGTDTHLPVRPALTIFLVILSVVAFVASIAGENQKIKITARKLLDSVADRNYDEAYDFLSDDAKKRISPSEFRGKLSILRTYLRFQYGPSYKEDYGFYFEAPVWIPWRGDDVKVVSAGLYRKGKTSKDQVIEMLKTPPLEGPVLPNLLTFQRERGIWKVTDLQFRKEDYADVFKKANQPGMTYFTPTDSGFVFEGFVYDRNTVTLEQRAWLLDALKQATQELERDAGKKKTDLDNYLKFLP